MSPAEVETNLSRENGIIRVTAHCPNGADAHFDHEYYQGTHLELVTTRLAPWLREIAMDRGVGAPGGGPAPFMAVGHLFFDSVEDLEAALAAHGPEVLGDMPNFTNVEPVIQISEAVVARQPLA